MSLLQNKYYSKKIYQFIFFTSLFIFINNFLLFSRPGDLDSSFGENGVVKSNIKISFDKQCNSVIQPDGKIIVAAYFDFPFIKIGFVLSRYNQDGTLDKTFNDSGIVYTTLGFWNDFMNRYTYKISISLQDDGKIVVAGSSYTGYPPNVGFALARYNKNGTLDGTFGIDGIVETRIGHYHDELLGMKIQKDGKIVAVGVSDTTYEWKFRYVMIRYNQDGTIDSKFGINGKVDDIKILLDDYSSGTMILQNDGKIVLGGYIKTGMSHIALTRYDTTGIIDSTFGNNGIVINEFESNSVVSELKFINSDKILAICSTFYDSKPFIRMLKYNLDWTIDNSFGKNGKADIEFPGKYYGINSSIIQNDEKIICVGSSSYNILDINIVLIRINPNGEIDSTFGSNGIVKSIEGLGNTAHIQQDNKIIVLSTSVSPNPEVFFLVRYLSDIEDGVIDSNISIQSIFSYPNPVKNEINLNYYLLKVNFITIELYDIKGNLVKTFLNNRLRTAGRHNELLTIDDNIPKGAYTILLQTNSNTMSMKIVKD